MHKKKKTRVIIICVQLSSNGKFDGVVPHRTRFYIWVPTEPRTRYGWLEYTDIRRTTLNAVVVAWGYRRRTRNHQYVTRAYGRRRNERTERRADGRRRKYDRLVFAKLLKCDWRRNRRVSSRTRGNHISRLKVDYLRPEVSWFVSILDVWRIFSFIFLLFFTVFGLEKRSKENS